MLWGMCPPVGGGTPEFLAADLCALRCLLDLLLDRETVRMANLASKPSRGPGREQLLWLTGRRIRYVRELRGMSGMQVAQRAGIAGTSLSAIENGRSNPTLMTLGRIATALGCSVRDLMPSPGTVPEVPIEDGGSVTP